MEGWRSVWLQGQWKLGAKAPGELGAGDPKAGGTEGHPASLSPSISPPPTVSFSPSPALACYCRIDSMDDSSRSWLSRSSHVPVPGHLELLRACRPRPSQSGEAAKSPPAEGRSKASQDHLLWEGLPGGPRQSSPLFSAAPVFSFIPQELTFW